MCIRDSIAQTMWESYWALVDEGQCRGMVVQGPALFILHAHNTTTIQLIGWIQSTTSSWVPGMHLLHSCLHEKYEFMPQVHHDPNLTPDLELVVGFGILCTITGGGAADMDVPLRMVLLNVASSEQSPLAPWHLKWHQDAPFWKIHLLTECWRWMVLVWMLWLSSFVCDYIQKKGGLCWICMWWCFRPDLCYVSVGWQFRMGGGTSILVGRLWAGVGVRAGAGEHCRWDHCFCCWCCCCYPGCQDHCWHWPNLLQPSAWWGIISEKWQQPLLQKGSTVVIATVGWFSGLRQQNIYYISLTLASHIDSALTMIFAPSSFVLVNPNCFISLCMVV